MSSEAVREALKSEYVQHLLDAKSRQLCRRRDFRHSERSDLEHDLVVHILLQEDHFDPSRGSVMTFIARVCDSAIAMMIRSQDRIKRGGGRIVISLETPSVYQDGNREMTLGQVVTEAELRRRCGGNAWEEQEERSSEIRNAMTSLSPGLKEIARRLMREKETQVAEGLGISRRQVRKAKKALCKHFRHAGI